MDNDLLIRPIVSAIIEGSERLEESNGTSLRSDLAEPDSKQFQERSAEEAKQSAEQRNVEERNEQAFQLPTHMNEHLTQPNGQPLHFNEHVVQQQQVTLSQTMT